MAVTTVVMTSTATATATITTVTVIVIVTVVVMSLLIAQKIEVSVLRSEQWPVPVQVLPRMAPQICCWLNPSLPFLPVLSLSLPICLLLRLPVLLLCFLEARWVFPYFLLVRCLLYPFLLAILFSALLVSVLH
jgi:hypothetical protein